MLVLEAPSLVPYELERVEEGAAAAAAGEETPLIEVWEVRREPEASEALGLGAERENVTPIANDKMTARTTAPPALVESAGRRRPEPFLKTR